MMSLYNVNGLIHWTQKEIHAREKIQKQFEEDVLTWLKKENNAWSYERIEAPIMLPIGLVNKNYTSEDLWTFYKHKDSETQLVARPETTPSTYVYMVDQLESGKGKLPMCVYQVGKSFRVEQEQVTKNMRLKEFYQMEFQCAYSSTTFNDYHTKCLQYMANMISFTIGHDTRIVPSDRLPDYSEVTTDIEFFTGERWMEIASISKRKDFPIQSTYVDKKGNQNKSDIIVLEIAIGLDRCVYAKMLNDKN